MITAKRKPPGGGRFTPKVESLDDLVAAKVAPAKVHLVHGSSKIVPTRWCDAEGRWLYVAEIDADGGGRDRSMALRKSREGQPPLYGIFADAKGWASTDAASAKMERMLIDRLSFPWSSFEFAQQQLDRYATLKGWQRDPPLPEDDEQPKPTRRKKDAETRGGGDAAKNNRSRKAPNREEEAYSPSPTTGIPQPKYASSSLVPVSSSSASIDELSGRRWKDARGRWLYIAETSPHIFEPYVVCAMNGVLHKPKPAFPNGNWPRLESAALAQAHLDGHGVAAGWSCEPGDLKSRISNLKSEGEADMPTKTKQRSERRKKDAETRRRGDAETDGRGSVTTSATGEARFEHARLGVWEAAEEYLREHRVPANLREAWLVVLPDCEHVSIGHDQWRSAVEALLRRGGRRAGNTPRPRSSSPWWARRPASAWGSR